SPAVRAVKLFQALEFEGGSSRAFRLAVQNGSFGANVDGLVGPGTLFRLNAQTGVIWTQNDDSVKAQLPNDFDYAAANGNRWMHASIPAKLAALTQQKAGIFNRELLVSNSAADGGRFTANGNQIGQAHWAGSEVELGCLDT